MARGQVWVETVIYTLIGLSLIGLVLAIATPKINEYRDNIVVEQTKDSLVKMDDAIDNVLSAPGNVRVIDFSMKKGELYFDGERDKIYFVLNDTRSLVTEPGVPINLGRIEILTREGTKRNSVMLTLNYELNITYEGTDNIKKISSATIPYRISIENAGFVNEEQVVDIKVLG